MKDYYKTLGVPRNATEDGIKKAYRRLALLNHPDKNRNDPKAAQRFQEIGEAYETLSDKEKRSKYDNGGDKKSDENIPRPNTEMPSSNDRRRETDFWGPDTYDPDEDDYAAREGFVKFDTKDIVIALRTVYPACEVCNRGACRNYHRWYTPAGYVWDHQDTTSMARMGAVMVEDFGRRNGSLMRCIVCQKGDCDRIHRNYTREGAICFFMALAVRHGLTPDLSVAMEAADSIFGPPQTRFSSSYGSEPLRNRRSSYDDYDDPRDDYRGGGGYGERQPSYSDSDHYSRPGGGYRDRGTTYIPGTSSSQRGSNYGSGGTSYSFNASTSSRGCAGESFRESSRDNYGPSRRYNDDDRYGSSFRDPDSYDSRDSRSGSYGGSYDGSCLRGCGGSSRSYRY